MTKGIVAAFNARRGVGYVQHHEDTTRIPFTTRDVLGAEPGTGDSVEFAVVGGKAGIAAKHVRRIDS